MTAHPAHHHLEPLMPTSPTPATATSATPTPSELDMSRAVIEHALIDYGYSPDTARFLLDRLIAEARAE